MTAKVVILVLAEHVECIGIGDVEISVVNFHDRGLDRLIKDIERDSTPHPIDPGNTRIFPRSL